MALIKTVIETDSFQVIRDKIAAILLDELANQSVLDENPDLAYDKIWKERRRPFNLSEIPAINLSIGSVDYAEKFRGGRKPEIVYFIDVYNSKLHDSSDADELVMDSIWHVVRTIQYILDHPAYGSLLLSPLISHTEITKVTPGQAEMSDGGQCGILRIEFLVKTISVEAPFDLKDLDGNDTTVKLIETDLGYYYQLEI